jgi:hypothetical protein
MHLSYNGVRKLSDPRNTAAKEPAVLQIIERPVVVPE